MNSLTEEQKLQQLEMAVEVLRTKENTEIVDDIINKIRNAFSDLTEPVGKESARIMVRDITPKINKLVTEKIPSTLRSSEMSENLPDRGMFENTE